MEKLDDDSLQEIFEHLSYLDYLSFLRTSRGFYGKRDINKKIEYMKELFGNGAMEIRGKTYYFNYLSSYVAFLGDLDVIKHLHNTNSKFSSDSMKYAKQNRHDEIVRFLSETYGATTI